MERCFVGGLVEGGNYFETDDMSYIDLHNSMDLIIVDRKYFLENISLIFHGQQN